MASNHQHDLEFLAKVSHELRGPLHSILGLSEMLVDGELGSDDKRLSTQSIARRSHSRCWSMTFSTTPESHRTGWSSRWRLPSCRCCCRHRRTGEGLRSGEGSVASSDCWARSSALGGGR